MPQDSPKDVSSRNSGLKERLGMVYSSTSMGMILACFAIGHQCSPDSAKAGQLQSVPGQAVKSKPTDSPNQEPKLKIVATVNGQDITRDQLARECLRHYGKKVLERVLNKLLIAEECATRNVTVTKAEVDAEIQQMAGRFNLPVSQWLKMLKKERGIDPKQYANDIIWPTIALRKLAGNRLKVTDEELQQLYEMRFGPAVQARLISCKSLEKAMRLQKAALNDPDNFGNLAKRESEDYVSASANGLIEPIRMHGSYREIEQVAFNMRDGDVSDVINVANQYVFLKREKLIAAQKADFEKVKPRLREMIRDKKLRKVSHEVFRDLQDEAEVVNVMNDPEKSSKMPGIAALVNNRPITFDQLSESCIERHGKEVLAGTINRVLLEQACEKQNVHVTEEEIDKEIEQAASIAMKPKADGSPEVEGWLNKITEKQGISVDVYRRDSVWPSIAMKKLVVGTVRVAEEDLKCGFEANYGPRVRCRAIVLDNLRRAQKVWEMARSNPTVEYFGELAEQYSIEPSSKALKGEVAPIRRHGGQPTLEKEAFSLKPGELSGIVQAGGNFIILLCESWTKPVNVKMSEVRDIIREDVYEKKLRIAVQDHFQRLSDGATIDNYLSGTSKSPANSRKSNTTAKLPKLREVSGG